MVGVNTSHPNTLVVEAIEAGTIPELTGYASVRREIRYGQTSRVDFLLEDADRPPCYVEVKNVHLMRQAGLAEFPDSVTARGARHLDELAAQVATGARAVMLFLIQIGRPRGSVSPATSIRPMPQLSRARKAGVEALAYRCRIGRPASRSRSRVALIEPEPARLLAGRAPVHK